MASPATLPKTLLTYAITIPLALVIGYLLISPLDRSSFYALISVVGVLCMPLMMRSYHTFVIFAWNASILVFFLPGQPLLWMLMVAVAIGFAVLNHVISRKKLFIHVPALTFSLVALAVVILLTAQIRGGIGIRVLGSSTIGGKGYILILASILGYFALAHAPIARDRVPFAVGVFILPGVSAVLPHVIALGGPALFFLYNFFPASSALTQVAAGFGGQAMVRLQGLSMAGVAIVSYLLARYGIRGLLTLNHPWRLIIFILSVGVAPIGGFRTVPVFLVLLLACQFTYEGLFKTRLLPVTVGCVVLGLATLAPFARSLPPQFQRAISFLPVDIDPLVRLDADASTEWRLEMWKSLLPSLPNYILIGKGYSLSVSDLMMTQESIRRGYAGNYSGSMEAGDYHSGPLSVYIPFGGIGSIAFIVFIIIAGRSLYLNMRYGEAHLKPVNTFLISLFTARVVFFTVAFGAFNTEFYLFTGIVGFSVALNNGVKTAPAYSPVAHAAPAMA